LSLVAGGADVYEGANDLHEGHTLKGAGELTRSAAAVTQGGADVVQSAYEMYSHTPLGEEAKEAAEHTVKTSNLVSSAASGVGDLVGGAMDFSAGYDEARHGRNVDDKVQGWRGEAKGLGEMGSGLAEGTMALTGTQSLGLTADVAGELAPEGVLSLGGVASVAGPALGAFAAGVGLGDKMESITKQSGFLKDDRGRAENGSDRVSRWGQAVAEKLDPSSIGPDGKAHLGGQSTMARLAGGAVSLLASPVGAALDAAGTISAGAEKLWAWL
jgi:hypothetical protein